MRIAMIGQKRTGSREGGVEVVVTELATHMAALGHEVTCYDRSGTDINGNEAPKEPYELNGFRVVPVRTVNAKGMAALSSAWFATRRALKNRPDVIHYHAEGPCNALPAAKRAGIRTVATIHGLDWQRAKWGGMASRVIKRGEHCAVDYADELIVLSQAMKTYFRDEYSRDVSFIPNGIEIKASQSARLIKERWGLERGSYVLYVGRIVPEKRPELLVQAFKNLPTDKSLVIAGGSSDTPEFYDEVSALADRDSRVVMAGFVEGNLLSELYSNAYCYVLPSDVEGMPMSLLEAMSYGCCCVTSNIPECADVLNNCGETFSKGDIAALRNTLTKLLNDPLQVQALGNAAKSQVYLNHRWDSIVETTLSVYEGSRP